MGVFFFFPTDATMTIQTAYKHKLISRQKEAHCGPKLLVNSFLPATPGISKLFNPPFIEINFSPGNLNKLPGG